MDLASGRQGLFEDRKVHLGEWSVTDGKQAPGKLKEVVLQKDGLVAMLVLACAEERLNAEAGGAQCKWPSGASPDDKCTPYPGATGASSLSQLIVGACLAHYAMTFADTVTPYYLVHAAGSGGFAGYSITNAPPKDLSVATVDKVVTIQPVNASDRASWALFAVDLFREIGLQASWALSTGCPAGVFKQSCAKNGSTFERDYAEIVAANLLDVQTGSLEAAEKAAKYLHASAQAKQATRGDRSKAREVAWRDPYDSLLRAASAYVAIPANRYNSTDANGAPVTGRYPVVTALSVTDADRQAEGLIREHRVDPRLNDRTDIADRIVASLNGRNGNAFASWANNGLGYLATLGISSQDLDRAAKRIVQETKALGRPILSYQDGSLSRVYGTEKTNEGVNPWYLYSITETAAFPSFDAATPDENYARKGVFHAMDYFMDKYSTAKARTDLSAKTKKMLDSAYAYSSQYVGGRLAVVVNGTTTVTDGDLRVIERDAEPHIANPPADLQKMLTTAFSDTYDMWLDEEGLLCALQGVTRSGAACDPAAFKLVENTWVVTKANAPADQRYPYFELDGAIGPGGKNPFVDGAGNFVSRRIYVTKRVDVAGADGSTTKQNMLLAGFALNVPGASGYKRFLVPISSGLAEALKNTLAVDPLNADETAQLCGKGGLPRNINVGLEDELLQAQGVNSGNTVDESWAYYLSLAKSAADEADMLGTELVDRGLEMDMRAEDAREELEDLCGGTVNVGDLRDRVCADGSCDLMKFLKNNSQDESLAQVRQCLGIDATTDAVLGPDAVCSWQMDGLPPCTCPKQSSDPAAAGALIDAPKWAGCPGRSTVAGESFDGRDGGPPTRACVASLMGKKNPKVQDCERLFMPPRPGAGAAGGGNKIYPSYVHFTLFQNTLGISPSVNGDEDPPPYACSAISAQQGPEDKRPDLGPRWKYTRKTLRQVAERIKVDRDHLNFVTLMRDGSPWLSTGNTSLDPSKPNAWQAKTTFPCAPLNLPDLDCSGNAGLLCSLDCRASSNNDAKMLQGRLEVGERLAMAAEVLRQVSGADLSGIEVSTRKWKAIPGMGADNPPSSESNDSSVAHKDGSYVPNAWEAQKSVSYNTLGHLEVAHQSGRFAGYANCDVAAYFRAGGNGAVRAPCSAVGLNDIQDDYPLVRYLATGGSRGDPKLVDSYRTCIQGPFNDHGMPTLTGAVAELTPPSCTDSWNSPFEDGLLYFFDAGTLTSWPRPTSYELAKYWAEKIPDDLNAKRGAFLGGKTDQKLQTGDGAIVRFWPALSSYTRAQLRDAFELACIADHDYVPVPDCDAPGAAPANGVSDLAQARQYLACRANKIREAAATMVLNDAPAQLVNQLRGRGVANIYPTFGGAYAQSVNELHRALTTISSLLVDAAEQNVSAGLALEVVQSQLREAQYRRQAAVEAAAKELEMLQYECSSAQSQAATTVALAALSSSSSAISSASNGNYGAAFTEAATGAIQALSSLAQADAKCSVTQAQAVHAKVLQNLATGQVDEQSKQIMLNAAAATLKQQAAVEKTWQALRAAYSDAQAALASLATQRQSARRAAAKLLMLDNDDVGHEFQVNSAMRARLNTLRVRYERARDYAIRMAYLARRSIEQKIGIELADLGDDVGWVPAPRGWADTICALEGIDYSKLHDNDSQEQQEARTGKDYDYANQYVGDYVAKLNEFMTAYVNTYVSSSGQDVALVSIRDELAGIRNRQCEVQTPNELLQSYLSRDGGPLTVSTDDAVQVEAAPVWESTCLSSGLCVQAVQTADNPFAPLANGVDNGSASGGKAGWGALQNPVRAVRLTAGQNFFTAEAPPQAGLAYWYRADACTVSAGVATCADKSGNGRTATSQGSAVAVINSGIGGKPTLNLQSLGASLRTAGLSAGTTEFTVSFVLRSGAATDLDLANTLLDHQTTASGNVKTRTRLVLTGNGWTWYQQADQAAAPGTRLTVHAHMPPQLALAVGDILTIRGGGQGVDYYVNGVRRNGSELRALTTQLAGSVASSDNAPMQFAEALAYAVRLSDAEIEGLHGYLGARYLIPLRRPTNWLSGDVVQQLRTTGQSALSGYEYPGTTIRDAANGRAIAANNPLNQVPPAPFANGHFALPFAGGQSIALGSAGKRTDGRITADYLERPVTALSAYAITIVATCSGTAKHRLFTSNVVDVPSNALAAGVLSLDVDGSSGRVQFENTRLNGARQSASGLVSCGNNAPPFIVTLRASRTRGEQTDLFVNGALAYSDPKFATLDLTPVFGASAGVNFVGALAEALVHTHSVDDDELAALHAELGLRYGIATADPNATYAEELFAGAVPPETLIANELRYQQWTNLAGGTYVLSWYEPARQSTGNPYLTPALSYPNGQSITFTRNPSALTPGQDPWLAKGWVRHWGQLSAAGDVLVAWKLPSDAITTGVLFAAPQLELVDAGESMTIGPSNYAPTDDDYLAPIGVCEDYGGDMFRQSWVDGCEVYCPPNTGNNCAAAAADPSKLPRRCYHELKFHVSQEEVERGELIPQGGFAAGNFNYRWEELAVNVVGTAVKNCEDSETASACYANNFLKYSLRHDGPFTVRNYFGRNYEAPIYTGRIQQGSALMAERYLTNPLSSSDRNLLQDFWDREFIGRPLEGNYTLRIYDTDGLHWEALEDIQLLMHYRYWTRLD